MNTSEANRLIEQALAQESKGHADAAEKIFERIIAARPQHNVALHFLGLAAARKHEHARALELLGRAAASNYPDAPPPEYHIAHASALGRAARHAEAVAAADRAIAMVADNADALFTRGVALRKLNREDDAIASLERALLHKSDHFDALNALGAALMDQPFPTQRRRAVDLLNQAVALRPKSVEAQCNLGNALRRIGKSADALAAFRAALDRHPHSAEAHNNLAIALQETGDIAGAIACFRKAIELREDYAEAHWNLGLALLHSGEMSAGWLQYEWRASVKTDEMRDRPLSPPQWNGGPLQGRTILLRAEQGMGDTLQFVRYAQILRQRGARVVLECQLKLSQFMKDADGIDEVVERGGKLPPFDTHMRLLSLPSALGTTLETIPQNVPYLHAQPQRIARWKEKLGDFGVTEFTPPLDEQGAGAFLDTAAVMMNLDLVITSDTAIAHLAGGLGVPVWVALGQNPDWRWMSDRIDSPWYPTMRLFRQSETGGWPEVFARIATELAAKAGAPAPVRRLSVPISPGELVIASPFWRLNRERSPTLKSSNTFELNSPPSARSPPPACRLHSNSKISPRNCLRSIKPCGKSKTPCACANARKTTARNSSPSPAPSFSAMIAARSLKRRSTISLARTFPMKNPIRNTPSRRQNKSGNGF